MRWWLFGHDQKNFQKSFFAVSGFPMLRNTQKRNKNFFEKKEKQYITVLGIDENIVFLLCTVKRQQYITHIWAKKIKMVFKHFLGGEGLFVSFSFFKTLYCF